MLDDFKTALKKLGTLKLQAAGGPQPNDHGSSSDNKSAGHEIENLWGNLNSRERRASISGRALEPNEVLDQSGRGCRKASLVALGRVGTKLHRLPGLPSVTPTTWKHSPTAKQTIQEDVPLTGNITVISSGAPNERPSDEHTHSIIMKTEISSGELQERPGYEDTNYTSMRTFPGDGRGASSGSSHTTLVPKRSYR
jgi:hypothetical protein